jgi:hypothetical protein
MRQARVSNQLTRQASTRAHSLSQAEDAEVGTLATGPTGWPAICPSVVSIAPESLSFIGTHSPEMSVAAAVSDRVRHVVKESRNTHDIAH